MDDPGDELARIDFAALSDLAREPIAAPSYALPKPGSGELRSDDSRGGAPRSAALHPARMPCTESLPTLRRATAEWDEKRDALDGEPLAAEDRPAFHAVLSAARESPAHRARGATWVSPRAYWMFFLAGFCAIEQEDYAQAERWLESAVALSPENETGRGELTHALVFQRKFDRADAIVETTIATSQDRCDLARAWRRRGYIRFEQRRLDEARAAYVRSLEYDPDSPIARSELELLRREITANGGSPDWYVPPTSVQHVTVCPPS